MGNARRRGSFYHFFKFFNCSSDFEITSDTPAPSTSHPSSRWAFGMMMTHPNNKDAGGHTFGFNGKYADDEVYGNQNSYAFKARIHDPRIGRFMSVDPLAKKYPHNSTYAFSENRVMDGVELEGKELSVDEKELPGGMTEISLTLEVEVKNKTWGNAKLSQSQVTNLMSDVEASMESSFSKYDKETNTYYKMDFKFTQKGNKSIDFNIENTVLEAGNYQQGKVKEIGNTQNNEIHVSPFYVGRVDRSGMELEEKMIPKENFGRTSSHEGSHTGGLRHKRDDKVNKEVKGSMEADNLMIKGGNGETVTIEQLEELTKKVKKQQKQKK